MKALVTGVKGQLGYDVMNELKKRGYEGVGVDVEEMDITDLAAVRTVINNANVDCVVHCAAYTAVDAAEDNKEVCMKVNVDGTRNIAKTCRDLNIPMVYISTDYVFQGEGDRPWEPDDPCQPLNVYGESKYGGEVAITDNLKKYFIIRTAWVFGVNGHNFIKTMLKLSETHDTITVVDDQVGSPTYTPDLAVLIVDMIETEKYGFYHATNTGYCSWYEFAKEIFRQTGRSVTVKPVSSKEYGAKAKRPHNSRMNRDKLTRNGFEQLPPWQDATARYLEILGYESKDKDK